MLRIAQRKSRQVARSILTQSLYAISQSLSSASENLWYLASVRQIHNATRDASTTRDAIYVYDTSGNPGFESDAVTLGLLNSLAKLKPGLGLFCPVDRCMRRGYKSELFNKIMMLHGCDVAVKKGVTMDRAYQLLAADRQDELLGEILEAYMTFRENHDFVVLEGTNLRGSGDVALNLNVDIAYTLNTASLLVANAKRSFNLNDRSVELEKSDWKQTLLDNIKVNELAFKHNHVDVMGALVYNLPGLTINNNSLQNLFEDRRIACFGAIPEDSFLQSCQDQNSNPMLPVRATLCTSTETALALENLCSEISSDMPCKILQALTLLSDNINSNMLEKSLQQVQSKHMNPKIFQYNIFAQAKQERQHIVLPEGEESRTIQAAGTLLKNKLCNLTLLGDPEKINELASQFKVDLKCAHIINPLESPLRDKYATMLYEYRKEKGVTKEKAYDLAKDATYFGTLIVAAGDADGMVSGAIHTTADTIRPALQIIKTEPGLIASSVMFICLKDKVQVFADCAVNVEPTSKELAAIAVASAETAMAFGIKPLVAMLSYATGDSNDGPSVQKVRDAKNIALQLQPNLCIEGPLQYDAAVNLTAAKIKLKGQESTVAGKANILVFPELNAGNIAYKAVQQERSLRDAVLISNSDLPFILRKDLAFQKCRHEKTVIASVAAMRRLFPLKAVTIKNSNKFLIQRKVDKDAPFFCDYLKENSSASSIFVAKDSEQNSGFLWPKQSKLCEGKGILALRISSEGESRKRDRSLKLIQGEMESRTKILENEKTDLQEALEKEIDRRSNEWACLLEKIRSEERKMRERVRDLAKQNVELQRELSSLNNREIHVKTQSEEFEQVQQELKSETLLVKILQEKICSNEADLEQLEEEVATLVRNQDVLTSNIENLEGRLSSSNQKEKELELLLGGKENTIRCLQADLQECLKELALLRGEIPKISEERDDFQQDAERLKCQNMELISEVESLKMRVEKLQEDVLVREGQLSILQESLNA